MDERVEAFLADVLAFAGEEANAIRQGVRGTLGLLGAQQLVVVEKDPNGRVTTKEIMPVLFSVLEGSDQPAFRAS